MHYEIQIANVIIKFEEKILKQCCLSLEVYE